MTRTPAPAGSANPFHRLFPLLLPLSSLALLLIAQLPAPARSSPATSPSSPSDRHNLSIIPLDQVRIGMKGYGLTVFEADRIEPFAVEVVSIMYDFEPGRGVIWVRCPEPRLQKTGPVSGMSGSPIYLWDPGQEDQPGRGGRLAGAVAYGFSFSKDCYFGVQPIEYMLALTDLPIQPPAYSAGSYADLPALRSVLLDQARSGRPDWRSLALLDAIDSSSPLPSPSSAALPLSYSPDTTPSPLLLPLPLSSQTLTPSLAAFWHSLGFCPVSLPPGMLSGKPPAEIDPARPQLVPGAVAAIPLAFGDMELCAVGTITAVLPDGRLLAFGHSLLGEGQTALPLATGFVHLVAPSLRFSFKIGSSCIIRATFVRDAAAGALAQPQISFSTARVNLTIYRPGLPERRFRYQVILHPRLSPLVIGLLAAESLAADGILPSENTLAIRGTVQFRHGPTLSLQGTIPAAQLNASTTFVTTPLLLAAQNPFHCLLPDQVDLHLSVENVRRQSSLAAAQLDRSQVRPGQSLALTLHLQPFGQPPFTRRLDIPLPADLPEGDYQLIVCDASTYQSLLFQLRPHLRSTHSLSDLLTLMQEIFALPDEALFVVIRRNQQSLALGRTALPFLPSSRQSLLALPTMTLTSPYQEAIFLTLPMDSVPAGEHTLTFTVKKDFSLARPAPSRPAAKPGTAQPPPLPRKPPDAPDRSQTPP